MASESWWRSALGFICTIIVMLAARILMKIVATRKEKTNQSGRDCNDVKFCLNRCVSNEGKDSGLSGDKNSTECVIGKAREKIEGRNSANGRTIGKIQRIADSGEKKILKGPMGLPFIGCLHLLGGSGGAFQVFTILSRKYGEIYSLRLGSSSCVVVSSYRLVKEVLITKGNQFGGRPNFLRFHELFGGDRNNSLALCDWSDVQRIRRSLARNYCTPRSGSAQQAELGRVASTELHRMLDFFETDEALPILRGEAPLKPVLLATVANMFTHYMCSSWFSYADAEFLRTVRVFDEVFWDINQGYAIDFLPWLSPFYASHMKQLRTWSADIRSFILERIVNGHQSTLDLLNGVPRDFTDALLLQLESPESCLTWDQVIFEVEDFLGGHSAIGNLVMLMLAHIVKRPAVQTRIQAECDAARRRRGCRVADLDDRLKMPYTEAVIWETLRVSSSPIVPHVASQDTDIDGYPIPKDTIVFVNNYELNLGEAYWGSGARDFCPERFLARKDETEEWRLMRPEHFIPFSTGKRTCVGQRLVQGFTFATVAALFSRYSISPTGNGVDYEPCVGSETIAMPPDTLHIVLTPRTDDHELVC